MKKKISEITANFTFFDEKTEELEKGEIVLYGVPEKKVKQVIEEKTGKKILKVTTAERYVTFEISTDDFIKAAKKLESGVTKMNVLEKDGE